MDGLFGDKLFDGILTIIKGWKPKEGHKGRELGGENEENDDLAGECEEDETEEEETDKEDEALKILKMRYARGEITKEDFEERRKDLEEK